MAVIGAFVRIDVESAVAVRRKLSEMDGVSPFDLDEPDKIGLVIEAVDLDEAHAKLGGDIKGLEGVFGAWPVYVNFEPDEAGMDEETVA